MRQTSIRSLILTNFSRLAYAEGYSFLVLLFICMPLKYALDWPWGVKIFGWLHGLLFMVYLLAVGVLQQERRINVQQTIQLFLIAVLPFGPWLLHSTVQIASEPDDEHKSLFGKTHN